MIASPYRNHFQRKPAPVALACLLAVCSISLAASRPSKLTDFTKGESTSGSVSWNMGPTGIIGIHNRQNTGDQIRVVAVRPGSPAQGKILKGDVILGVGDKAFAVGGHMGMDAGYAIMAAEEEANKGILKVRVWRDRNWIKRAGPRDMFGVDVDAFFQEVEDDADLYDWKDEEEKTASVAQMAFDKYPIDAIELTVELQLKIMGTYSDSSPWDCPVVAKAREDAWRVIAGRFETKRPKARWPDVLAMVASGKPEYLRLAREWVHSQKLEQNIDATVTLDDVSYRGMQSWQHGFGPLEMAIYHEATGDDYVLPAVRRAAIQAALGQNGGGSWGHTFAFREFNGGFLHRNNPGYGAMNNAGGRCFYLLALAKKAGIKHPEVDAAIGRADRFFRSFVDKGCIPYGYHSPAGSDDSNGKNYGVAYAFYALGQRYEAKFFSMHSAHAAFTRRGGHGSPTLWYYTPLSANIAGPDAIRASQRNMRWFYTLSRCHDGSFVFLGDQKPGIGGRGMRNPTATLAMILSAPLQNLMITGKDADTTCWMTDEELNELLISARGTGKGGQIKEPTLLKQVGTPWNERSSAELVDMLDHFYPNMRVSLAKELGKRYAGGEKDILGQIVPLLTNPEARMRDGACRTLAACGPDTVLGHLSTVVAMLRDDSEFVRITAVNTIGGATKVGDPQREIALLQATVDDYDGMTMDNGNVRNATRRVLFGRKGEDIPGSKLNTAPFEAGLDEDLVRSALERVVTLDPGGVVPQNWTKQTLIKMAGPVTFSAEELQLNDAMFGGARKRQAQALLSKHGYREAAEGNAANLIKRSRLERSSRRGVQYKDAFVSAGSIIKTPGQFRFILDDLRIWQQDNPLLVLEDKWPPASISVNRAIALIERAEPTQLPSIAPDVAKSFAAELQATGDNTAQLTLCRNELKDLDRPNFFRKMAAMTALAKRLGPDAIYDVSPFLGHQQWRLRNHAEAVAIDLINKGAGKQLLAHFDEVQSRESGLQGNLNAAGILDALAHAGHKPALATATLALKHRDPAVRHAAVKAVFALGGEAELNTVIAFMKKDTTRTGLHGAEQALLSKRNDPLHVRRVSEIAIDLLPSCKPPLRRSLAWTLGQFGGAANLAAIQTVAASTERDAELAAMVISLAYSPDRAADQTLIGLAKLNPRICAVVAAYSVHRMVGRNGVGDRTDAERVQFARAILSLQYDNRLIAYLGRVHTGASAQLLFDVMKKGGKSTQTAVAGIVSCVEGMKKPSPADAKIATSVLTEVIEYIEVTRLRGGVQAHMKKDDNYIFWKNLQTRAGKAMLRFHNPHTVAIPTFDDSDLDF